MLPLWRYDVKDFEKHRIFFFVFCIFLHENKTKSHDFNRFRKVKERATTIVPWENCPKKESAYPKSEIDIDRLQNVQKHCKDHILFLVSGILYGGEQQRLNSTFWRFLFTYICLSHPLEKFVVFAF